MAEQASPQLVWQLVKKNNCFLRRNVNNTWFSTEPGNLRGRNSYKYSGAPFFAPNTRWAAAAYMPAL